VRGSVNWAHGVRPILADTVDRLRADLMVKIYRSWYMTAGRWDTTIGYFWTRKEAEGSLPTNRGAASGDVGIEEIRMPERTMERDANNRA